MKQLSYFFFFNQLIEHFFVNFNLTHWNFFVEKQLMEMSKVFQFIVALDSHIVVR